MVVSYRDHANRVGSRKDEEKKGILFNPFKRRPSADNADAEVARETAQYSVVMMRHGESAFNKLNVFTGWCDVPLTEAGKKEAVSAGETIASQNVKFDVAYCSVLQRSSVTCHTVLESCGQSWIPVRHRWELNERHYGSLQGLDKAETAKTEGQEVVRAWRQKYHQRPPEMNEDHPHWPLMAEDRRYTTLMEDGRLPRTESLADTAVRVMDLWNSEIAPAVKAGKKVLIVAHRNSLRALLRNLEGLDDSQVEDMHIPTGVPFCYPLDSALRPVAVPLAPGTEANNPGWGFQGEFLTAKPGFKSFHEQCMIDWETDPANPSPECYSILSDHSYSNPGAPENLSDEVLDLTATDKAAE